MGNIGFDFRYPYGSPQHSKIEKMLLLFNSNGNVGFLAVINYLNPSKSRGPTPETNVLKKELDLTPFLQK